MGHQARQFVATQLGQYLLSHWQDEQQRAMQRLAEVDPFDSTEVQKAQNALNVAYEMEREFFRVMERGEEAMRLNEHTE